MRLSAKDKDTGDDFAVDLVTLLPTQDHMNMFLPPKGVSIEKFAAAYRVSKAIKDELRRKDEALAAERREVERLKSVIERLSRTMGEKSEDEKKLKVGECLKHFEKTFRVQEGVSEGQRGDVLRRVKVVLENLGHEKHYVRITENDLIAAVTASGPKTLRERSKRIQNVKRFCTWLCRSPEKGGLGFVGNPGSDLKAEGEKAIQAKRRATGKVSTLDPKPLMNKLPLYWRTFLAVMGYAGLRCGEAAGLTWDAVDFENRIIHVRANKFYQQLKTELSERPVPPFQELWKILEEHRKAVTHPELVFPRLNWERWTNPSWLTVYKGRINAYDLSDELADALTNAGISEKEPSRRLRRYWETRMRSDGYGQFVAQHAGHSDEVGKTHYTDWQATAKDLSAKMRAEEEKKSATESPADDPQEKSNPSGNKARATVSKKNSK